MTEEEQLAILCRRFGAQPPQDRLMARKLLERADQISRTREMNKLQALQYLLSLMNSDSGADSSPDGAPTADSSTPENSRKSPDDLENR